jgi:hypothetical protein
LYNQLGYDTTVVWTAQSWFSGPFLESNHRTPTMFVQAMYGSNPRARKYREKQLGEFYTLVDPGQRLPTFGDWLRAEAAVKGASSKCFL